jgi:hypothetical protein
MDQSFGRPCPSNTPVGRSQCRAPDRQPLPQRNASTGGASYRRDCVRSSDPLREMTTPGRRRGLKRCPVRRRPGYAAAGTAQRIVAVDAAVAHRTSEPPRSRLRRTARRSGQCPRHLTLAAKNDGLERAHRRGLQHRQSARRVGHARPGWSRRIGRAPGCPASSPRRRRHRRCVQGPTSADGRLDIGEGQVRHGCTKSFATDRATVRAGTCRDLRRASRCRPRRGVRTRDTIENGEVTLALAGSTRRRCEVHSLPRPEARLHRNEGRAKPWRLDVAARPESPKQSEVAVAASLSSRRSRSPDHIEATTPATCGSRAQVTSCGSGRLSA